MALRRSWFASAALALAAAAGCEQAGADAPEITEVFGPDGSANYVGCFTDAQERALPAYMGSFADQSPDRCRDTCYWWGYPYAGVQYGTQCFCGSAPAYDQVSDDECDAPCGGRPDVSCGGSWRNSIYVAGPYDPPHQAELYEHADLGGESLSTSYTTSFVGWEWNDRISSLRLPRGWNIVLYEHSNRWGARLHLSASDVDEWTVFSNLEDYGFNDRVSSYAFVSD